jgi:hypothetical protein
MDYVDNKLISSFEARVKRTPVGCWKWTGAINPISGYGQISFQANKKTNTIAAHRLSYLIYKGSIPDKMVVMHTCDTPSCVNPRHLVLGSVQDNLADMRNKNRHNFGERNGGHKLKASDVVEIRESDEPIALLANRYHVSAGQISRIKQGKSWKLLR